MLTNPLRTLLAITLLATTAAPASAQPAGPGSFSVTLKAAWDPTNGGVMHEGGSGTVLGLPTSVDEKPWSDTHNQGFRLDAGIGFGVSERAEIVARWEREQQCASYQIFKRVCFASRLTTILPLPSDGRGPG